MDNYQELYEIGTKGVEALKSKYGTNYRLGSIANIICKLKKIEINFQVLQDYDFLDIASGSSLDWVKAELKTNVSYAYEFRDEGRNGFTLPANQIISNSVEVFASIVAILKESQVRGIA